MLFSIGTRVKLLRSKDLATVSGWLNDEMVNVRIDGSEHEIPVYAKELIRLDEPSSIKAKIVPGKRDKVIIPPERPAIESQYLALKHMGIQLAFDPVVKPDGEIEKYEVFLINDSPYDVLYDVCLIVDQEEVFNRNGKLNRLAKVELDELLFDELNDSPIYEIDCWPVTTEGTGAQLHKNLKIKAKQFFKKRLTAPILNKMVHLYDVFKTLEPATTSDEDLQTYTKRKAMPNLPKATYFHLPNAPDPTELAAFVPEIDLHIENLSPGPQKLNQADMLRIQLNHFEKFIAQAKRLGVTNVFVIHGVGEGKLRDAIASYLVQDPAVKTFKNEYHPKYGFGATEVFFEDPNETGHG